MVDAKKRFASLSHASSSRPAALACSTRRPDRADAIAGNGHNHPHMVSPALAAKDWVHVQATAELLNLTLVSPAVGGSPTSPRAARAAAAPRRTGSSGFAFRSNEK